MSTVTFCGQLVLTLSENSMPDHPLYMYRGPSGWYFAYGDGYATVYDHNGNTVERGPVSGPDEAGTVFARHSYAF